MKRLVLILAAIAIVGAGFTSYRLFPANNAVRAEDSHDNHHGSNAKPSAALDGPLANATISFGAWRTTPAYDRVNEGPAAVNNAHVVLPQTVKIKAGGAVNFIISGLHQVIVYDDGTQPSDIDVTKQLPAIGMLPPLINDSNHRLYRGPDPRLIFPNIVDRVEVVHFANPGTYLVICGVLPHFQAGMYGFVKVVP